MLMAGLDGIKNKIDPGQPLDEDLYALPENKVKKFQQFVVLLEKLWKV